MVCGLCLFVIMWAWGFNVFARFGCELSCGGVWCGVVCFVCSCVCDVLACNVWCDEVWFVCCVSVCVRLIIWLCDIVCDVVLVGFVVCVFVCAVEHVCVSCL